MTKGIRFAVAGALAGVVFLAAAPARARQPQTPAPPPCAQSEHRQFDFWAGEWDVTLPDGTLAGTNRIEIILDGCVLLENWASANGKSQGTASTSMAAMGNGTRRGSTTAACFWNWLGVCKTAGW